MMKIAEAQDKATLKKFRPYIENAKVILVDLEGDQLGPNGTITYVQINTFDTAMCFLIDIKLIGDDELRKPDGWLRKIFENPEQAIIMFGGLQDAANLYASYDIRVECMVDLQVVEVHYREALKESAYIQYHQKIRVVARFHYRLKMFTNISSTIQRLYNTKLIRHSTRPIIMSGLIDL